eukprot:CAMPEP_0194477984 /NCGR_PEP_ID=MMETSP0253-20130528/1617_1 /TAXON_ID=2966 /ORGANISM="Noctiluca scintillans" /LENGTH=31 /DNA_ID= /DNA_START= /DNA_END= /DNA_ORIENTATION=
METEPPNPSQRETCEWEARHNSVLGFLLASE